MSEELAVIESEDKGLTRQNPREIIAQATEEANILAEVIEGQKLYSMIGGKKFVKCEGWVTLATLRGCLPREVEVTEMPEGRYVAKVELVRVSDGSILTSASAECGGPEDPVWFARAPNARRSMAITRATGKACRVAFSWVMALSGFEVTPAEEMIEEVPRVSENSYIRAAAVVGTEPSAARQPIDVSPAPIYILKYGKYKGQAITMVDNSYLDWLIKETQEELKDPEKANFKSSNDVKLVACLREKQRRVKNGIADGDEEIQF